MSFKSEKELVDQFLATNSISPASPNVFVPLLNAAHSTIGKCTTVGGICYAALRHCRAIYAITLNNKHSVE